MTNARDAHRSLEGLDCLGMLSATPTNMGAAWFPSGGPACEKAHLNVSGLVATGKKKPLERGWWKV